MRKSCEHARPQLSLKIREAAAFGTYFITKRWEFKTRFIPTCSVKTPEGQDKSFYPRTLAANCLSRPVMYNGRSPETFSVEGA